MLVKVKVAELRRTTSRVKKAFFDIIGERIKGARFLDLYAGEGRVGIEALKRGARFVLFVEKSKKNGAIINKRLMELHLSHKARVVITEVGRFMKSFPEYLYTENNSEQGPLDILFADPPYSSEEYEILINNLSDFKGLKDDALVCIEHFHKNPLPDSVGSFVLLKSYRYGDTILSFYRRH